MEEESIKVSLEKRYEGALEKAKEIMENYFSEEHNGCEPSLEICLAIDMQYVKEYVEHLISAYKKLEEIDSKEVSDALHLLLHCSLKDTEFETQKEQFKIVNAYIKKLEEENKKLNKVLIDMVNQFAYDDNNPKTKGSSLEKLYTGGLSALEDAFNILDIDEGVRREELWKKK